MPRHLEAIYEQGILHPIEPLVLAENQRVHLTLEEESERSSREAAEPVNERREELCWLANESGPYAGEWAALSGLFRPILKSHHQTPKSIFPPPSITYKP